LNAIQALSQLSYIPYAVPGYSTVFLQCITGRQFGKGRNLRGISLDGRASIINIGITSWAGYTYKNDIFVHKE
jgi:hypothetical protein